MILYDSKNSVFFSSLVSKSFLKHGFGTKNFSLTSIKTHVHPKQTHSDNISVIDEINQNSVNIENCDGLITKKKGVVLTVITADCVPMIFADEKAGIIGISHQGWKGTLNRLPGKMIDIMLSLGASVQNIYCLFGPAINDCCYEIYGERLNQFKNEFKSELIFRKRNGVNFLNLIKANYLTLTQKGIRNNQIDFFPFCTSCDSKMFYSYHRDKKIIGEMTSFVMQSFPPALTPVKL